MTMELKRALLSLAECVDRNPQAFMGHFCELAGAMGVFDSRPQSLWEKEKRRAVLEGLWRTEGLEGDVAELGVFQGGGTFILAEVLDILQSSRRVYACDSFEGLPAPLGQDAIPRQDGRIHYVQGMFKETSYERLDFMLRTWGKSDRVRLVKGFFEDVLPKAFAPDKRFSMVILDSDQYSGTRFGFEFFYNRIPEGGMIFVDDYNGLYAEGVTVATNEFLADKPETMVQGGKTMWYCVKQG